MKIVQLITRMDEPGGAQIHVRDICLSLKKRGHEVSLICGSEVYGFPEFADNGIPCFIIKSLVRNISPLHDLRAWFEVRKKLKSLKPDLVAAHSSKAGMIGRVAGWSLGIPTIFTAHGWAFTDGVSRFKQKMYVHIEHLAGKLSTGIITVSHYDYELAKKYRVAAEEKLAVIQNGVMETDTENNADPKVHPSRLVMVARFAEPKNHLAVLSALANVRQYSWNMDFVGDGPLKIAAEKYAVDLGLSDRIRFLGNCSNVADILADAQIFVLVSNWEGLPLSILEAMQCGLPVIASDVGGINEAVVQGVNGYLIPRGDAQELTSRLAQLITSPELRLEMGQASSRRFKDKFTFNRMIVETELFYQKTIISNVIKKM